LPKKVWDQSGNLLDDFLFNGFTSCIGGILRRVFSEHVENHPVIWWSWKMRSVQTSLVASSLLAVGLLANTALAATFTGNGATGFGGPIGTGSITVTETTPGTLNFALTTGNAFSGNALILYFDTKAGGVSSTSTLTDNADGGRTAISGLSGSGRTLANFPVGFTADYAATVEPGVFGGLFDINNTPGNFGFVASGGLSGSGTSFNFSYTRAQLGLSATAPFSFVGSLISTSGYRSNETFGTSVTTPGSLGDTPNAGFTGTTTFATANVVPEPATLGTLAAVGLAALRRRK
jgi:hypothetical protein